MEKHGTSPSSCWGLLASFADAATLAKACEQLHDTGYTHWDAHTPFAVSGLADAVGSRRSRFFSWAVLCAGLAGAVAAFIFQWWTTAVDYPLTISGRSLALSAPALWAAFTPIAFEFGALCAACAALFGFLHLVRLPRYNHPAFASSRFLKATDDAFFISVQARDQHFDATDTAELLRSFGALEIETLELG